MKTNERTVASNVPDEFTHTHTHTQMYMYVYVSCIYKHEQKNVTSGRANERSSEFSVFSVFVLLLQHCLTHRHTHTNHTQ